MSNIDQNMPAGRHESRGNATSRGRGRPVSEEKSRDIETAAILEFGDAGYVDASMDVIATRAGVSKATLYARFGSKEAMFLHVVNVWLERMIDIVALKYDRSTGLKSQLKRFVLQQVRLLEPPEHHKLFGSILAEHIRNPDFVGEVVQQHRATEYGFENWVVAAAEDGKLRVASAHRASHHFMALVRGLVVWPIIFGYAKPDPGELNASIEEAVGMFLGYYGTKAD